ncbi:tRNA(Glu)-specific nuclease WapA precursor [Planctomycetes bacterium Pan216]|uniref:tRNA(Glu)-specific nuclease WapA n=1 Tax=Kolteria novifilia TaxID=2527975 RepID=A0A518B5Y9_9BACT|nr:tRNA(Glu)-specific nuclease WapA precursor [Planctomycetes bacterium Pan216]
MVIDADTGLFTWTPEQGGLFTIVVQADDGRGAIGTQEIILAVLDNAPPKITSTPDPSVDLGNIFPYQITTEDPNVGDTITLSLLDALNGVSIDGSGLLTWTPTEAGVFTFTLVATDSVGDTARQDVRLQVIDPANNRLPELASPRDKAQVEREFAHQFPRYDIDGDTLTYTLISGPDGMALSSSGLLSWTPDVTMIPASPHSYTVRADDGRGGVKDGQFTVSVVHQLENKSPVFLSDANTEARLNGTYRYEPQVVDPDGDSLSFRFDQAPLGMYFANEAEGIIQWSPWSSNQIGDHQVILVATDAYGAETRQEFTVSVVGTNRPPLVDEDAQTYAILNELYEYQIKASDPDGDSLTLTLDQASIDRGMSIDVAGLVTWTPTQAGIFDVSISIVDAFGTGYVYDYEIEVSDNVLGPEFTSLPNLYAVTGEHYVYDVSVFDIEDDRENIVLSLEVSPSGATFDPETGHLEWFAPSTVPEQGQLFGFAISAIDEDGTGLTATQSFTVLVERGSDPPIVTPESMAEAEAEIGAGARYTYDIEAYDPDNTKLTYELLSGPDGLTVDSKGRVRWQTGVGDIGTHDVSILITDGSRTSYKHDFTITVTADVVPPEVTLEFSGDPAVVGSELAIRVFANDTVGYGTVTLTVNGVPIALDGYAIGRITFDQPGDVVVTATATDPAGNTGMANVTLSVIDTAVDGAPEVAIALPEDVEVIGEATDILGRVIDTDLVSYTFEIARLGSDNFVELASGTDPISFGVLGRIDPTTLPNGPHVIRLTAEDAEGNVSSTERLVSIDTDLKFGNFGLTFVDLEIPNGDMPIVITRSYDTLDADELGDFGYGWTVDIANTDVEIGLVSNGLGLNSNFPAFHEGSRVTITLPDGSTESFTFRPQTRGEISGVSPTYDPYFRPDAGVTSQLIVPKVPLRRITGTDEYVSLGTGVSYNPQDPGISSPTQEGGTFILRTKTGLEYLIDAKTGELTSMTNLQGDTLTFGHDYIATDSGRRVSYVRDAQGRITEITDPRGNKIRYTYDPDTGDLLTVTDRVGNKTTFVYDEERPHYLTKIIDPRGVESIAVDYSTDTGDGPDITDAEGNNVETYYDSDNRQEFIVDALGNTTTITYDERGNPIREVDPTGVITLRTYDEDDNLLTETLVVGLVDSAANGENDDITTEYSYDANGNRRTTEDARGNVTRTNYNQFSQPTTTIDPFGNVTKVTYDGKGLPTEVDNPLGANTTYGYDDDGNLETVTSEDGVLLVRNTYNDFDELTEAVPANGPTNYFDYDANGNQVARWHFIGEGADRVQVLDVTRYDANDRVESTFRAILPLGSYIEQGIANTEVPGDFILSSQSVTYTFTGQVDTTTDENGLETKTIYDLRGQAIEVRRESLDENGNTVWLVTQTVYDEAGRVIMTTDPFVEGAGETIWATETTYDAAGRRRESIRRKDVDIVLVGTEPDLSTEVVSNGTEVWRTRTDYDDSGRTTVSVDQYDLETHYTYNQFGETVETRTQSLDETGTVVWLVSRTVYDSYGRASFRTDQYKEDDGQPIYGTETLFDDFGRPYRTIRREGVVVDLADGETTLTDAGTELWKTRTTYNDIGQVAKSQSGDGQITDYEYDDIGRRVATNHPATIVDGELVRHRTETVYNTIGQVEQEITGIRLVYDADTGEYVEDRADARTTTFVYDERGNVIETIFTDGTSTKSTFDDLGRKLTETNQEDQTRSFVYDALGRLGSVVLPAIYDPGADVNTTADDVLVNPRYDYGYDERGNQTSIRDAEDRETTFTYDERGNQLTRTLPDGLTESFEYDDRGRMTLHVSFEGVVKTYGYDAQGMLEQESYYDDLAQYADGTGTPTETVTHQYDAFGREIDVTRRAADDSILRSETWDYDAQGRLVQHASPEGIIGYGYDDLGRKTSTYTVDPADTTNTTYEVRYSYDELGRLKTVETIERNDTVLATPEVTEYDYDLLGNLDEMTGPNGVIEDYEYDQLNRLEALTHYAPDATPDDLSDNEKLAEFTYVLRNDGRREGSSETFYHEDGTQTTVQYVWTFDELNRLTQERIDSSDDSLDRTVDYVFDLVGNRLRKAVDLGNDGTIEELIWSTYDENDRLLTEIADLDGDGLPDPAVDRETTYGYTGTQQTGKTVAEAGVTTSSVTFTYDLMGRMSKVETTSYTDGSASTIETVDYEYDAMGIRVAAVTRTDDGADGSIETTVRTEYLTDHRDMSGYAQTLRETTSDVDSGETLKVVEYTRGHDEITQTTFTYTGGVPDAGETLVFGHDGKGSVRVLTDLAGAIASVAGIEQVFVYDAYGNLLNLAASQAATSLLYNGEYFDGQIGQQYLRARWYDPNTGRFNRLDPFFGNLQDPQSLHKYLYTHADPVNVFDPTGRFGLGGFVATVAIGGAIGASLRAGFAWYSGADSSTIWNEAQIGFALGGLSAAAGFGAGLIGTSYWWTLASNAFLGGIEGAFEEWLVLGDIEDIAFGAAKGALFAGILSSIGFWVGSYFGIPQGLSRAKFDEASSLIRSRVGEASGDIVVQGSRVTRKATPKSDIDFGIRVSKDKFDELLEASFGTPTPGSAAERTMSHAIRTGKIQSGEARLIPGGPRLRQLRKELEQLLDIDVDISVVLRRGPFDGGPTIRVR